MNELVNKILKEKEEKKILKLCETAFVIKTRGKNIRYSYYKLPKGKKISECSKEDIQAYIKHIKTQLKPNEYIFNTNL